MTGFQWKELKRCNVFTPCVLNPVNIIADVYLAYEELFKALIFFYSGPCAFLALSTVLLSNVHLPRLAKLKMVFSYIVYQSYPSTLCLNNAKGKVHG